MFISVAITCIYFTIYNCMAVLPIDSVTRFTNQPFPFLKGLELLQ